MRNSFKIFSLIALSAFSLTSCIEETFPESDYATSGQIAASSTALEAALRGIPAQMAQGYLVYGEQNDEIDMAYPAYMIAQTEMLGDMYPGSEENVGYDWYSRFNTTYRNVGETTTISYLQS